MPGPIVTMESTEAFQSCEDVQEAWGCVGAVEGVTAMQDAWASANDNLDNIATLEDTYRALEYNLNGSEVASVCEEALERMELDDDKLDLETMKEMHDALTRRKILSMQHGRTLSYADKEDEGDEAPTRRPQCPRGTKVTRNPSYQAAMKSLAPFCRPPTPPTPSAATPERGSSESSLEREASPDTVREKSPSLTINNNVITCPEDQAHVLTQEQVSRAADTISRALECHGGWGGTSANMNRSASFSAPQHKSSEHLSVGSLSQGNSRTNSTSPLPSATPAIPGDSAPRTPVRGSVLTRSFKKLFNTPIRSVNSNNNINSPGTPPILTTTSPSEEYWPDVVDSEASSSPSPRPSSRLRRLSSNLTRRLSNRSPKMAANNGGTANGVGVDDCRGLVEYEELLKLFLCTGCHVMMAPPFNQCRKGHLICQPCRSTLKHQCPMCKQRFHENPNLMMEQVCLLVRFPCKFQVHGCPEYHLLKHKTDHEHFCSYRPVHCHHGPRGCPKILSMKDMQRHHEQCEYKSK